LPISTVQKSVPRHLPSPNLYILHFLRLSQEKADEAEVVEGIFWTEQIFDRRKAVFAVGVEADFAECAVNCLEFGARNLIFEIVNIEFGVGFLE